MSKSQNDDQSLLDRLNALKQSNVDLGRTQAPTFASSSDGEDDIARRFLGLRGNTGAQPDKLQPQDLIQEPAESEDVESIQDMLEELKATEKKALAPDDEKRVQILLSQANEALAENDDENEEKGETEHKSTLDAETASNSETQDTTNFGEQTNVDDDAEADEILAQILDEVHLQNNEDGADDGRETASPEASDLEAVQAAAVPSVDENIFPTTPSKEPQPAPDAKSDELTLPSAPTSAPAKPAPKSGLRKYTDAEVETWCEICQANAELRCLGCDGDLYCVRCWKEGHTGPDAGYEERQHRCVQYSKPGHPEAAAA